MSYKLTDSEVKNALCEMVEMGFETISYVDKNRGVNVVAITDIIDLINRQKEFAKRLKETLAMLNAQELAGVSQEYNNRYFYENPKAWTDGSTTARNEAITIINNLLKEMEGEDK